MKQCIHFWLNTAIAFGNLVICDLAWTQIVPDTTLPENSSVTTESNTSTITGGTVAGTNLFHSFSEFSLPSGTVYFNNPANIQNIISRVTGGSVSNINGLIRANGSANLLLINPNGIIFGSNAALNIGGSFLASTASSLKFADNRQLSSTASHPPLLTVSVPVGLQFGENAAEIQVQGNGQNQRTTANLIDVNALSGNTSPAVLTPNQNPINSTTGLYVLPTQTLALVGGNVSLTGGTLKTSGGRIELGSVTGSGLVNLTPTNAWTLSYEGIPIDAPKGSAYGNINLSQGAVVDASGAGGGEIQIQGRRVAIADSSQIESTTLGAKLGGKLTINASESLEVMGTSADGSYFSGVLARVEPEAIGSGSNLNIKTGNLIVRDGGVIATSTRGVGRAGDLTIAARQSVQLSRTAANSANPSGLFSTTERGGTGFGGNLTIETGNLIVQGRAVVATGTTSQGQAGDLNIKASEAMQVSDTFGLFTITAGTLGRGDAGNLTIETGKLAVRDNARLSVASGRLGSGKVGELKVTARSIELDKRGSISAVSSSGNGGNIQLDVQDLLLLRSNSQISTQAGGNGGNITIDTNLLTILDSSLSADAQIQGGKVEINTQGLFRSNSEITATSAQGPQYNGIVEINTPGIEPSSVLLSLPTELVDVSGLINQGCLADAGANTSRFIITGRGGLPPNPRTALARESPLIDLGTSVPRKENSSNTVIPTHATNLDPSPIIEAQKWMIDENGKVILTASTINGNSNPWLTVAGCKAS